VRALVRDIVRLTTDKKAEDPVVLDMTGVVAYTDYFVICSGRSARQARAISEAIQDGLRAQRAKPLRVEGDREAEWILLDYLDVVVHVFTPAARDFYRLETLWRDVPRMDVAGT
jgi:ribosome-associated protein